MVSELWQLTIDVLVAHQRKDLTSCICGWAELGRSHAEHVANALEAEVGPLGRPKLGIEGGHLTIPLPLVAPLGIPVDKPEYVQEVWDAFVKPEQEARTPQSSEMRMLMAILRSLYRGLGGY